MSSDVWRVAASQLWQVTLLVPMAVLLVRWLGRGRSHLAYGLLVVVLLKCVTPPIWSSRTGVFSWTARMVAPELADSEQSGRTEGDGRQPLPVVSERPETASADNAVAPPDEVAAPAPVNRLPVGEQATGPLAPPIESTIDWRWFAILALSIIWLLGTCFVAGRLLYELWRLRQWCRTAAPAGESIQDQARALARQMGLPSTPEVLVTDESVMPAAAGVWREVVLLPRHVIDSVSPEEFELVLAHELNHFRRWDTLIGGLQAVAQVVWWFHPLVWWLNRELRRYREQCCDEEILARLACRPPQYARCLLNVLELNERFSPALGLAGMSPFEVTSQRLRNIMRSRTGFAAGMPRWCWLVLVASALIVLPGAGLTPDANALPHVDGVSRRPDPVANLDEPASTDPAEDAAVAGADVPESLRYRWREGDHLAYRTLVEVDLGDEIEAWSGTLSLTVRGVDDRGAELAVGGIGLTSYRRPKPGRMPRLGAFSFPDIPTPVYGLPPERSICVDAQGRILSERGELERLPGLLGNWPSYVLEPLPETTSWQWPVASTDTVLFEAGRFREQTMQNRLVPAYNRQPATESLRADLRAECRLTITEDGVLVIARDYSLTTIEQVGGSPRAELSGVKSVTWDSGRGVPLAIAEVSQLVVREGNVATTYPITVTCELLQPAPEDPATDDAAQPAAAAPVTYDGPAPVPSSELPVTDDTPVEVGDVVQVEWSGAWYPADVLSIEEDGRLRIHFRGFSDDWDATVHRARVQLPGPEYSADAVSG